jgi:hypothetical protein
MVWRDRVEIEYVCYDLTWSSVGKGNGSTEMFTTTLGALYLTSLGDPQWPWSALESANEPRAYRMKRIRGSMHGKLSEGSITRHVTLSSAGYG